MAALACVYAVKDLTLSGHIKNQSRNILVDLHSDQQLIIKEEESDLLKCAQFIHDCNIPPDRETLEQSALIVLGKRHSIREKIHQCWIKEFWQHHREDRKYVTIKQISANRANADCWETNDDFFEKATIYFLILS